MCSNRLCQVRECCSCVIRLVKTTRSGRPPKIGWPKRETGCPPCATVDPTHHPRPPQQPRADEAVTEPNPFDILTMQQQQACEQFAAGANDALDGLCANVLLDIQAREHNYGVHDDSVSLYLTWEFVKAKMMQPGGPEFAAMLLAAALQRLARAPRASNPLAHLENEENNPDGN